MIKLTPAVAAAKTGSAGPWPHPGVVDGVPNEHSLDEKCDLSAAREAPPSISAGSAMSEGSASSEAARGIGVYIHFPWCIKKCPYCDFLSVPSARQDIPHEQYASAVIAELEARRAELGPARLRSV